MPSSLPWILSIANSAGAAVAKLAGPVVDLSPATLLRTAERRAGSTDWGQGFREDALAVFLDACEREAHLTALGRVVLREQVVNNLANRLRIEAARKADPTIADVPVKGPLFVIGLPRTGTSLLQGLLGADPANRTPLAWEVAHPDPRPQRSTNAEEPRIARMDRELSVIYWMAPELKVVHPMTARSPQECIAITAATLMSPELGTSFFVPSYMEWLSKQDLRPTYAWHRRALQHLAYRDAAERWVLKSPFHLGMLDALFAVYPDASIVHIHRDPRESVPSWCSLTASVRRLSSSTVDLPALGEECSAGWAAALRRALAERDRRGSAAFFDVSYRDLLKDPIDVVRRIYERFSWPFTDGADAQMRRYLQENPQHAHGVHRYTLEQFGLREGREAERFGDYLDRFRLRDPSRVA